MALNISPQSRGSFLVWADRYIFDISKHKLIYFQFWPAWSSSSYLSRHNLIYWQCWPVAFSSVQSSFPRVSATNCVQKNLQQGNILIHIIIGVFDEIDVLEIRSEICATGPGRHKSRILSPIRAPGPVRRLTTACTFSSLSIWRIGGDKISSFHRHSGVRQASNICLGKPQIPPSGDR